MPLHFESDLVVETGDLVGRVTGEGSTLRLHTDDPGRFVEELRAAGPSDTRGIRRVAEFLAEQGVSVTISGPRGDVLTIGAAASSRVGRLTAGSRRVAPGRPLAVAPLVRGQVRDAARSRRGRLVLALVALLALRRLLRHR